MPQHYNRFNRDPFGPKPASPMSMQGLMDVMEDDGQPVESPELPGSPDIMPQGFTPPTFEGGNMPDMGSVPPPENYMELPSGFDPRQSVGGHASYDGPMLNNPEALEGLAANQTDFSAGQLPLEELYRLSFRDPSTVAPGANEFYQGQLGERVGDQEFSRMQDQSRQAMINQAMAGQHPAVRAGAEQEAEYAAMPARAQSEGMITQAMLGMQGRDITARGQQSAAQERRNATAIQALMRAYEGLSLPEGGSETRDVAAERQQRLAAIEQMLAALRSGQLFLGDFMDPLGYGPDGFDPDDEF